MVIKSPFKDYYDFVANQYGGGDPKIVYARTRITPATAVGVSGRVMEIANNQLCQFPYSRWDAKKIQYLYLILAGKAYLLARPESLIPPYHVNTYQLQPLVDPEEQKLPPWRRKNYGVEFGKEYPFLVELCRKVGAPVFAIAHIEYSDRKKTRLFICGQCPILGQIGFPSLFTPQQMYQELSMFVGNQMKDPPDIQPPVQLGNKQKILKAGFDFVKSFRHRE